MAGLPIFAKRQACAKMPTRTAAVKMRLAVMKLTQCIGEPVEVFPRFTIERICQTASRAISKPLIATMTAIV